MRDGNGIFYYMHGGDQGLAPSMSAATLFSVFCATLPSKGAAHSVGVDSLVEDMSRADQVSRSR